MKVDTAWALVPKWSGRRMYRWEFAREVPVAGGRSALAPVLWVARIVVLAVAINFVGGYLLRTKTKTPLHIWASTWTVIPAFNRAPWANEFLDEYMSCVAEFRYQPFIVWDMRPCSTPYINVSEAGVRKSYQGPGASKPERVRVYLFGGSTMWGDGVRDEDTVPSAIARLAERDGLAIEVVNHAAIAYVHWQEVTRLSQVVAARDIPDIAVFYDGLNDAYIDTEPFTHIGAENVAKAVEHRVDLWETYERYSLFHILSERQRIRRQTEEFDRATKQAIAANRHPTVPPPEPEPDDDLKRAAQSVRDRYLRGVEYANRLAKTFGFRTLSFWQPVMCDRTRFFPEEAALVDSECEPWRIAFHKRLADALRPQPIHVIDRALDGAREPIAIDPYHINAHGNQLIAEAIWPVLKREVEAVIAGRNPSSGGTPQESPTP
jgi:lysophospholipase L1-like esterase